MYTTMLGNGTNSTPRAKKERKVSLVFRHAEGDSKHCAGIESLLLVPSQQALFTASRDSTIKRWSLAGAEPVCEASFESHADWVNDLVFINDMLVSCSNDRTVKIWKTASQGQVLYTMVNHSDYVTALAVASARNWVASAGLRSEVFLMDLETGKPTQLHPKQPQQSTSGSNAQAEDIDSGASTSQGSVYALAMNSTGTLLAAGTTENLVRLWDPRSGRKVAKLRGHTDNVRSVVVSPDGTTLLSGASDGTIRLWDIGTQRCLQTHLVHSDSVWHLTTSEDFSIVYSGGRDQCVYRTHLQKRTTELLFTEQAAVRKLAYDASDSSLWVATPKSSVNHWRIPPHDRPAGPLASTSGRMRRSSAAASSPALSMRMRSSTEVSRLHPAATKPDATIKGMPGIVVHKVMTDRRHVLTRDTLGCVALWDVLSGGVVESYGQVDFDAKECELFEAKSVPAWFSSDNRLGQLSITLEPPSCFLAEEYAMMLDYPNVADDYKVNYGKLVLDGAFAKWRAQLERQQHQLHNPDAMGSPSGNGSRSAGRRTQQQHGASPGSPSVLSAAAPGSPLSGAAHGLGAGAMDEDGLVYRELWPQYWQCPVLPAVLSQSSSGQRWRCVVDQFSGGEVEPDTIPTWVGDVVLRGTNVTPKEAKCAFILLPAEGTNLPSLMQSKLNAPRILQIHKVANYAITKLLEQNVTLDMVPQYLKRPASAPADPPGPLGSRPTLELSCNGVGLPYEMSLASVKKYIWRRSDDLIFHYRIMDQNNVIPLPRLAPGG